MPRTIGRFAVLFMIALAIFNAQCVASCSAGMCSWLGVPQNEDAGAPPCHQHQPAKADCAHPTPTFSEGASSALPSVALAILAIAGTNPTATTPVGFPNAALTEVWSPPSTARSSITILRI